MVVVWVELDTTYHEYGTPLNSVNVAVGKVVVVLVDVVVMVLQGLQTQVEVVVAATPVRAVLAVLVLSLSNT